MFLGSLACQDGVSQLGGCPPTRHSATPAGQTSLYAALRAKSGGEGSRTPVPEDISQTVYMLMRLLVSEGSCESPRHPLLSVHEIEFTDHRGRTGVQPACWRRVGG